MKQREVEACPRNRCRNSLQLHTLEPTHTLWYTVYIYMYVVVWKEKVEYTVHVHVGVYPDSLLVVVADESH